MSPYVQHDTPGADKEANWLPAPNGPFFMVLRLYWPQSEALDGRCSACQMAMRPQFFQELKQDINVMACESCLRILYYNPPVKFEDLTGEAAPAVRQ